MTDSPDPIPPGPIPPGPIHPGPIHPGKILYDQAMTPLGVSRNKLARDIDVPVGRISDIVAGKRGITPDTALRLGKYFGTSAEMWMQFQSDFDLHVARHSAWLEIEPRVRELEPVDPDAVAPVTAMDEYAETPAPADRTARSPDASDADQAAVAEIDPTERREPAEGERKWWSALLPDDVAAPSDDEAASDPESPEPTSETAPAGDAADTPEPAVETVEAEPEGLAASADASAGAEQMFEIDVRPTEAASVVVADGDEPTEETGPQFGVALDAARAATGAFQPSAEGHGEPTDLGPAAPRPEPVDEDTLAIELDEDDFSDEVVGDAFASAVAEDDEEREEEAYVPAIARTGTDGFGRPDPLIAAPGLDMAASASAVEPAAFERAPGTAAGTSPGDPSAAGIHGLTPANWSSALEPMPVVGSEPADPETVAAAPAEQVAAVESGNIYDVPLPPEIEPAMEGPLPPWPPADADDSPASLDIPEPGEARKLFEYDD